MFNSVNNPFNRKIESSTSSDSNKQQHRHEEKKEEKKYLEQEEKDEVKIGGLPLLTDNKPCDRGVSKRIVFDGRQAIV